MYIYIYIYRVARACVYICVYVYVCVWNDDVVPRLQVCQMGRASTVITAENVIQQARNGNTQLGVPAETAGSPTISPSGGRYSGKDI